MVSANGLNGDRTVVLLLSVPSPMW